MTEAAEAELQPVGSAHRAGSRERHRPTSFIFRGDSYDFHRVEDSGSLACLDRYTADGQKWKLLSGWVITPTGAEVRDIIRQVHGLDLPDTRPGEPSADQVRTPAATSDPGDARTEPIIIERERIVEVIKTVSDPADAEKIAALEADKTELQQALERMNDQLSGAADKVSNGVKAVVEERGEGAPGPFRNLLNEGEDWNPEARRRISEELNRELGELKANPARGMDDEKLARERYIETLLGQLARWGETS